MIKQIDIINLSHYDIGFTDHPLICRELHMRYLDAAIDFVLSNSKKNKDSRFYWTVESNNVLYEWWQKADSKRKSILLDTVKSGWIEVCAMPFNNSPMMNEMQWEVVSEWLPVELRKQVKPKVIIQDDVNGFPRAGVMHLMDNGAEFLWMAINSDTGGTPFPQPSAFWWEMPDCRRIFVWNSIGYSGGYFLFEEKEWRQGPLPKAGDSRYRQPEKRDFFNTSKKNLEKANKICHTQIEKWCKSGYDLDRVALSMTNMWRIDNDPPCFLLADFIGEWNKAGLNPSLEMTTPSKALKKIREVAGENIPTYKGEWTDWWANGVVSAPRELSASRKAKRLISAIRSPMFKKSVKVNDTINRCIRKLCLYDEHTFGSFNSIAIPDCLDSRGQFAEKSCLAYQPWVTAELAIGDENRKIVSKKKGIYIVNPYNVPYTGWVTFTDDCLRGKYEGGLDSDSKKEIPFVKFSGQSPFFIIPTDEKQFTFMDSAKVFPDNVEGKLLRLWVDNIKPNEIKSCRLLEKKINKTPVCKYPKILTNKSGLPTKVSWDDKVLFSSSIGDFLSLEINSPFPRWNYKKIFEIPLESERCKERRKLSVIRQAKLTGKVVVRDTGPTIIYEQYLSHPRLKFIRRCLEVFKAIPRVQLKLSIYRISKPESAEIFYVKFPLNCKGYEVQVTNGGVPFIPGKDQLENTCKDYFAIDGEVTYKKGGEKVVLDCYDSAVVSFGGINDGLRLSSPGDDLSTVYAVIYNNIWYTNFAGDESGLMEFEFDLYSADSKFKGFAPQVFPVVNV